MSPITARYLDKFQHALTGKNYCTLVVQPDGFYVMLNGNYMHAETEEMSTTYATALHNYYTTEYPNCRLVEVSA